MLTPLFIIGAFIWPNKAFQPPGAKSLEDADAEQTPLINPSDKLIHARKIKLYNVEYKIQFKSAHYWVPVLWLAFESLNISCYLGTVSIRFTGNETHMSTSFNLIWSLGWISIPFFGLMMDYCGIIFSMNVASVGLVIFNALKLLPIVNIQYVSFVLVSTVNVGMWAIFYSHLSAKFGFDNYGKLLGVSSIVTALIGALQYAIDWLTNNKLNGNFFYADVMFIVVSVICLILSIYVWYIDRPPKAKKKNVVEYYPSIIPEPHSSINTPAPTPGRN